MNVVSTSQGELLNIYDEQASVPSASPTTVTTYTVPLAKSALLKNVAVSGENVAEYEVRVNGSTQDKLRTYFGGNLSALFEFDRGLFLEASDIVTVTVLHNRPSSADFNATIRVIEL